MEVDMKFTEKRNLYIQGILLPVRIVAEFDEEEDLDDMKIFLDNGLEIYDLYSAKEQRKLDNFIIALYKYNRRVVK